MTDRNFDSNDREIEVKDYEVGGPYTVEMENWMSHFPVHTFWAKNIGNCRRLVAVKNPGLAGHSHIADENAPEGFTQI
jgi:hypothetical protein